jgi:hypothetical protein
MRGLKFGLGKSWPRNPLPPDPAIVRERTRAQGRPLTPTSLGL